MSITLVEPEPVPLWYVRCPEVTWSEGTFPVQMPFDGLNLLAQLSSMWPDGGRLRLCAFRAVSLDRLEAIRSNGVDVEPTDSVIYVDGSFEKAWEFGGWPKVLEAFDYSMLDTTYRELDPSTPTEEIEKLRLTFPGMTTAADSGKLWLSRLVDLPQICTPHEWMHARWIPGDPFEALKAIIVFGSEASLNECLSNYAARRVIDGRDPGPR